MSHGWRVGPFPYYFVLFSAKECGSESSSTSGNVAKTTNNRVIGMGFKQRNSHTHRDVCCWCHLCGNLRF